MKEVDEEVRKASGSIEPFAGHSSTVNKVNED